MKIEGKGIIIAPDFIDLEACFKLLKECRQLFAAVKIGNLTLLKYGISVLKRIKDKIDIPIICDFKLMDIPIIAEKILEMGVENEMDGAMIWGFAGCETVSTCITLFPDTMIFLLTEYTHSNDISPGMSNKIGQLAVETGAYGIQAPATKPRRITKLREIVGEDLKIISCGVGHQGAPYGSAVKHGADFEIIGRAICGAGNKAQEAEKALAAILSNAPILKCPESDLI
jgi:orotidine-5'-phosphate decarboxylase